jgi:hypothetical protein
MQIDTATATCPVSLIMNNQFPHHLRVILEYGAGTELVSRINFDLLKAHLCYMSKDDKWLF